MSFGPDFDPNEPAQNPYNAPGTLPGGGMPLDRGQVAEKLKLPATIMMVAMGIGIGFALLGIVMNVVQIGAAGAGGVGGDAGQAVPVFMAGGIGIVQGILGILGGAFVIYGMGKLKRLENYTLSMIATIVGMVPCLSSCCLIGLPVGIWLVVLLNDAQVKESFTS